MTALVPDFLVVTPRKSIECDSARLEYFVSATAGPPTPSKRKTWHHFTNMYTNDDTPDSKGRIDLLPQFRNLHDEVFPVQCALSKASGQTHPRYSSLYNDSLSSFPSFSDYLSESHTSSTSSLASDLTPISLNDWHFQGQNDYRYEQNHPYPLLEYPNNWYVERNSSQSADPRFHRSAQSSRFNSTTQGDSSLSHLTEKFINLLDEYNASHANGELDLNIAVNELGVQKRRLYDITNVLEGVGLIKKDRNQVVWSNRCEITAKGSPLVSNCMNVSSEAAAVASLRSEIEEMKAHSNFIDDCIEKLSNSVREFTKCKKETKVTKFTASNGLAEVNDEIKDKDSASHLFVTKYEIAALQAYHNDTVIAIRAPPGTNLEVPNPDEGMRPGTRRFQIYLTSPGVDAGPVKVMVLHNAHETRSYQKSGPFGFNNSFDSHPTGRPIHLPSNCRTFPHQSLIRSDASTSGITKKDSKEKAADLPHSDVSIISSHHNKPELPSLPPSQSLPKRPNASERSQSLSAIKMEEQEGCKFDTFSTIPPRPTLKRRSSDPSGAYVQSYDTLPKRIKLSPGTSRKPLKAALKQSPTKSPKYIQCLPSPVKGRACFVDAPASPCGKKMNESMMCGPTPIARSQDLLAPLDSPFLHASSPGFFASSPVPNLKGFGSEKLPASPFPFSPNINMGNADFSQFSPFIASPSISKMERQIQGCRDSTETNLPTLF
jgi:hypothetical protein